MKGSQLDGRHIVIDDRAYLYFYGTSYLGLPYDQEFQILVQEGHGKYGTGLGSSPLSYPPLNIYGLLEETMAKLYGFESALLFASGYAAGQSVVSLFEQRDFKVAYGNIAHPALKLETKFNTPTSNDKTLHAVDFIDPITFEKGNTNLNLAENDMMLVDASHGFGLFDEEIKTLATKDNMMVCGSLNKALGINAGLVLCSANTKEKLQTTARYRTSSTPSPAECYALMEALTNGLVGKKKNQLRLLCENISEKEVFSYGGNLPVLTFENPSQELFDQLKAANILIWRNSYPNKDGAMVNRAVITSAHKLEDVQRLIAKAVEFGV